MDQETIGSSPDYDETTLALLALLGDLAEILDDALDQEEEGGKVDLPKLWGAIKGVLENEPAASSHTAAPAMMETTSAAAAAAGNKWQCRLRDRGRDMESGCVTMTIKTGGAKRALLKCQAIAKKSRRTVLAPPVKRPCPD